MEQNMDNQPETVTISKADFDEMYADQRLLEHLRAQGVDNWDGWDDACASYHEEMGSDD
jgi:hypothetical protein